MKDLILVRGVSGAGKTTFADTISKVVFSADNFFTSIFGKYNFNPTKLTEAHADCLRRTKNSMLTGTAKIVVANTFVAEWEMKPYFELAKKYKYRISTVIVENRHGSTNTHGVPSDVLKKQKQNFNIKL